MFDIESAVFAVLLIVVWFHQLGEVSDKPLNHEYNFMTGLSLAAFALPFADSIAQREIQLGFFLTAPFVFLFGSMWFIDTLICRGVMKRRADYVEPPSIQFAHQAGSGRAKHLNRVR